MTSQAKSDLVITDAPTIVTPNNAEMTAQQQNQFIRVNLFPDGFKATTDYQDSLIFDARGFKQKSFQMHNPDTSNVLIYNLLASIDGKNWNTLLADKSIETGSDDMNDDAGAKAFYKFQVKTSAGTIIPEGTVAAWA